MQNPISNLNRLDIVGSNSKSGQEIFHSTLKRWREKLGFCSMVAAVPAVLVSNLPAIPSAGAENVKTTISGPRAGLTQRLNLNPNKRALLKRQSEFRLPHQNSSFAVVPTAGGVDDCPGSVIPGGNYTVAAPFTVSGDTTGANNTVNELASYYYYFYGNYGASGPDHVYSFTITGLGPNPQIEVSTTSGTYKPLAYVLTGQFESCPAGTGNVAGNWMALNDSRWNSGSTVTLGLEYFPLNVPLHLFVDSFAADVAGSGPYTIKMKDVTIAPAPPCSSANPIDCNDFFVRQQYRDFLGREPDAPGLAHWTEEITICGDPANRSSGETEAQCVDRKRTNTSGAFYLSNEFQNSANFLIRVNWGSLGKDGAAGRKCIGGQHSALDAVCRPLYPDYLADMAKLTQGIVVNDALDPNVINTNKHNFVNEFVTRADFLAAYPNTMTADAYVDKLAQTTGIALTAQERSDLINKVGTEGRAAVLYEIVDGTITIHGGQLVFNTRYGRDYYDQEFNPAFVFVQYLAYLRRNPDQAGYNHWLGKLNFYGNFVDAEMVRSFLISDEYRNRF